MNFWSGRSYKKCRAREANLLTKWAGIPKEEVEFIDVPITQEKEDFIHTIITGNVYTYIYIYIYIYIHTNIYTNIGRE